MNIVLPIIIVVTAGLGCLLLIMLSMRLRAVDKDTKLAKHRSRQEGLSDLLIHSALIDEDVVVGKNGSLIAAFLYAGADSNSSTEEERERVSALINRALMPLGSGWMFHIDAVRRPSFNYSERGLSDFSSPVAEAIDNERRSYFQSLGTLYEGYFVISLTWLPPALAERKLAEMMFDDDAPITNKTQRTKQLVDQFKREVDSIHQRLSAAFSLTRLKNYQSESEDGQKQVYNDLLSWINYCVTGISHPIALPESPIYLDRMIGGKEMWGGVLPKIGNNFIQVVNIEGLPARSSPGILQSLAEQPCEYRWSTRFICMDAHEAEAHLAKYRKKWKQKIRGFFDQIFQTNSGKINHDAVDMVADADMAIKEVKSGDVAHGYVTSIVVLMDKDRGRLESSSVFIAKAIERQGFTARVETINTMDAFFGSLPGHGVENVRRPFINTMNLADIIPTSSIWTGEDKAPCPLYPPMAPPLMHCVTNGATPFRLNLHVRDLGHTLMFGPTRAGKSTHLALIAAQLQRYKGMSVYCFDKGWSMYATTKATGGDHYAIAANDATEESLNLLQFCPLQYLDTPADRAWCMEWIDTTLALNGLITTAGQRNQIGHAIMSMCSTGSRTLSDFCSTVQDQDIREALQAYTISGDMGYLLDAREDGLTLSRFSTFEIGELMNLGEKYALPVLLYLFRRIERNLKGQPAAIILDEAWLMLAHPAFREKIREWLKAFAKLNCALILATQNVSDASKSGILDVIVESTATKIYLPNPFALGEDASELYSRMGLNRKQIQIIASAIPKQQYYVTSEKGRRLYELALGPLTLAIVGASDPESVKTIKSLEAKYGSEWVGQWLEAKGIELQHNKEEVVA